LVSGSTLQLATAWFRRPCMSFDIHNAFPGSSLLNVLLRLKIAATLFKGKTAASGPARRGAARTSLPSPRPLEWGCRRPALMFGLNPAR
jgi:hypothetical protein